MGGITTSPVVSLRAIICFIKSFPSSLQLLVHGQQIFDSSKLPGIFANEENDVLHLDATLAPDRHGLVGHFRDKLDHQILQNIHRLRVRVLVISKSVHHAPELLGEESLSLAVADIHPAGAVLQLFVEAWLVVLLRHLLKNTRKRYSNLNISCSLLNTR